MRGRMTKMKTNWIEKFIPDSDTCIALHTMGFRPKETTFVWADTGLIEHATESPVLRAMRRVEASGLCRNFPAPTAEEFQEMLPINFLPMRVKEGVWIIVDLYGSKMSEQKMDPSENSVVAGSMALVLSRVNGSTAASAAQAFAQAVIFMIQTGALKVE